MKKLLIGILTLISLTTFSFANTIIEMKCDHISTDNWPLGGESPVLQVEINNSGELLSGLIDGEEVLATKNNLVVAPKTNDSMFGNTYYTFTPEDLTRATLGKTIEVLIQGNDYMANFDEEISCEVICLEVK